MTSLPTTPPTAQAAAVPPLAVWETTTLDPGCPLVYRRCDYRLRVAYDPAQIDLDKARELLRTFAGGFHDGPAAEATALALAVLPQSVLDDPAMARYAGTPCPGTDPTPDQINAWEGIKLTILRADDPRAAAAWAKDAFRQVQAERAAAGEGCAR